MLYLAVSDLFFRARLSAALRRLGPVQIWDGTVEGRALVLVDLSQYASDEEAREAVDALQATGAAVLAFGPHRAASRLQAARGAGALVVSNRVLLGDPCAAVERALAHLAGRGAKGEVASEPDADDAAEGPHQEREG